MKDKLNLTEQNCIRNAYDDLSAAIDAIHLIKESSDTNHRASNALLLVVRQMAKTANIISHTFGSDWPENQ